MTDGDKLIKPAETWATIVPEFLVHDVDASLAFYTDLLGFATEHHETGRAAVVSLGGEQLALLQEAGDADPAAATGSRGVLLSIRTEDPKPTYERLRDAKYPIATPMEISELADGDARITKASFEIVDPDGYRLRFTD